MPARKQSAEAMPVPVVRRLPRYLTHVTELRRLGVEWVSSQGLAGALNLTPSTVRQDLSHLSLAGVSKRGYEIGRLEAALVRELGCETTHRCCIVGAGNLGCALALHGQFAQHGFNICALFDQHPTVIGRKVGRLPVKPMELLERTVQGRRVEIGIIAVPAAAAQQVADRLIISGVRGLLNLAYTHIQAPRRVAVVDARILASLQELAYALRTANGGRRRR